MGLPVSLFLIAVGAILAFAVHQGPNPRYGRRRAVVEEEDTAPAPPPGPPP
jgi:hypothetical protein